MLTTEIPGIFSNQQAKKLFKTGGIVAYVVYILTCVYWINGARGFWDGFWQMFVILSIGNLIDRIGIN